MESAMQTHRSEAWVPQGRRTLSLRDCSHGGQRAATGASIVAQRGDSRSVGVPLTHRAAGWQPALSARGQKRVGTGDLAIDPSFLSLVDDYVLWLARGCELGWIKPTDVRAMLAKPAGSVGQKAIADDLINQCLDVVSSRFSATFEPIEKALSTILDIDLEDWGFTFEAQMQVEDGAEFEVAESDRAPLLLSESIGVHGLFIEQTFRSADDRVNTTIFQLIRFCAELSGHMSSEKLLLSEDIHWLACGEVASVIQTIGAENLAQYSDVDALDRYMTRHWGVDWDDECVCSREVLCEIFYGVSIAAQLHKDTQPLSLAAVEDFVKATKRQDGIPTVVVQIAEILLSRCDWAAFESRFMLDIGHTSAGALRPVLTGLPGEEDLLSALHENSMCANESGTLGVDVDDSTPAQLCNIHLGESLLVGLYNALEGE